METSSARSSVAIFRASAIAASSSAFRICATRSSTALLTMMPVSNSYKLSARSLLTRSATSSAIEYSAGMKTSVISGSYMSASTISATDSAISSICRSDMILTKFIASSKSPNASVTDCNSTDMSIMSHSESSSSLIVSVESSELFSSSLNCRHTLPDNISFEKTWTKTSYRSTFSL